MPAALPTSLESARTTVFNVFASLGVFSTAFVLVPAFLSPHIKRSGVWFGVLISYLVYSVIYLLLAGRQFEPEVPLGLCFFQAILIYGIVPVCGVSTVCFSIDFYLRLSIIKFRSKRANRKTTNLLVCVPWIFGLLVTAISALCVNDVSQVRPDANNFYCHITNPIPSLINIIIILLCGLFINVLQIYMAIFLYRNWAVFKRLSKDQPQIAFSTFIRLTLFNLIVTTAIVLSIITATNHFKDTVPAWSIVLAACKLYDITVISNYSGRAHCLDPVPLFSALSFGAQKDILLAWLFWRRRELNISALPTTLGASMVTEHPRMTLDE
ncbi:hypothetical protein BDZ94DRAFT_1321672 [Collybia nuda]|uniref:Uncharacterized protein n=1 Tax=Collybia nuda TaxID=64659 RepID=A0A9P5Y589_9AGAR|nr:hypothetical protein BDZ94DRAFT_1321672 [Collybia nuda]